MLRRFLSVLIITLPTIGYCQFEGESDYAKEFLWGITKNTNSGLIAGGVLRHARIKKERTYETFGLEIVNVKHPKEQKYTAQTGTSFIWGKQNHLYAIRGQYGVDKILYKKAPQQGVQINAAFSGGPTIGIVAPYYVLTAGGEYVVYDPTLYPTIQSIQGSGKFLQGFGQSKIVPGINAKVGISFEFGAFKNNVTGVELGLLAEAYIKEIVLIPTQPNQSLFTSAFFTFYWGTRK
jgi:hypothetical protein